MNYPADKRQRLMEHGTNIYEIIKLNPEELKNPNLIFPGQKLLIAK